MLAAKAKFHECAANGPARSPHDEQPLQGFTVEGVGSWRLEVHDEIATMTESTAPADCVLRCNEADFVPSREGSRVSSSPPYRRIALVPLGGAGRVEDKLAPADVR